jgi:hypothetical protein
MPDEPEKFDRFKPQAPKIPGVPEGAQLPAQPAAAPQRPPLALVAGGGVAALLLVVLIAWWAMRPAPPAPQATPETAVALPAASVPGSPAATASPAALPVAPGPVATVQEMAKPWTAKPFIFRRPFSDEQVAAYVVRLPTGAARSPQGYWAFAAGAPNQQCQLEFVADLERLAREFQYRASHPMAVDPCSRRVYDPLRLGDVLGVWVRGEVVAGPAGRPPLAILVRVEGDSVIAAQIE